MRLRFRFKLLSEPIACPSTLPTSQNFNLYVSKIGGGGGVGPSLIPRLEATQMYSGFYLADAVRTTG